MVALEFMDVNDIFFIFYFERIPYIVHCEVLIKERR